jgi:hypothetical protein
VASFVLKRATAADLVPAAKICVAEGVQACNLGVPILKEELDQFEAAKGTGRTSVSFTYGS